MSDYELTTVTLPSKDEITDKTAMSLQQWESAFDIKNFTDFTFTFTNSTTNSDSSVTTQESQNAVMTSGDGKIIHVLTYLDDSVGNERYYDYTLSPVSYTHLDVYKRQILTFPSSIASMERKMLMGRNASTTEV